MLHSVEAEDILYIWTLRLFFTSGGEERHSSSSKQYALVKILQAATAAAASTKVQAHALYLKSTVRFKFREGS